MADIINPIIIGGDNKLPLFINNKLEELTAEDIAIVGEVTNIRSYAFYNLTNLKKVTLPPQTLRIDVSAFQGCSNLTEVTNIENVTSIGGYAFNSCAKLEGVFLNNNCSVGERVFGGCQSLKKLKFGKINTTISQYVLQGSTIGKFEINEGVIGTNTTFYQANINKCILPTTLTTITNGFSNLNRITNLIIKAETPPTLSNTNQITNITRAFVSTNHITDYQTAENWSTIAGKFYPLIATYEDLANVTDHQYACVKGNDLGIEDDNNYKVYQYIDGAWYEI